VGILPQNGNPSEPCTRAFDTSVVAPILGHFPKLYQDCRRNVAFGQQGGQVATRVTLQQVRVVRGTAAKWPVATDSMPLPFVNQRGEVVTAIGAERL
jgi:hypothetical protein